MKRTIDRKLFLWHSPAEVWEYLTRPELIELWLGKTDFQPIPGHKFRFISPYDNHSHCEVLVVQPFTTLSYSWRKNSSRDNKPFQSTIVWTLTPKENGTELQLVHSGFTTPEDTQAHENGWQTCLCQLEEQIKVI